MVTSDFLILGSGIAGLSLALRLAEHGKVVMLSKDDPREGSTLYAQGGIASVVDTSDSFEAHISDTISSGDGLCNEEVVNFVVHEGPERIAELIEYGVKFDFDEEHPEEYHLGREGGHSKRRILHARDATGAEIVRALLDKILSHENIELYPHHIAIDLIPEDNGDEAPAISGCYALKTATGEIETFGSKITYVATGGAGKVYLYTSNPDVATGDGIAMAYRAGAQVANMEFFQFHPTCLYHPRAKSFLITEAMRGEGAVLLDVRGQRFMDNYHTNAELAPRDIVARAIDDHMKRHGDDYVLLDISHKPPAFVISHFPTIHQRALELGFDITREPIPVVPAAHYCCGGIKTDAFGRTSLPRLYAVGEAAHTGLHGANRLASNSLLEAVVFSYRAATDAIEQVQSIEAVQSLPEWDYLDVSQSSEEVLISHYWDEVRRTMWNLVGIVRSTKRLELARRRIDQIESEIRDYYWKYTVSGDLVELRNITHIAQLIIRSALLRKESRGLHYTTDFPEKSDTHLNNTILSLAEES